VVVDEDLHVAYVSSPGGFMAIGTRTGAVLATQHAVGLSGDVVAVDSRSHHIFVGGPHSGPASAQRSS